MYITLLFSCHIKGFGTINKNLNWSKIILNQQNDGALIFDLNFISGKDSKADFGHVDG